MFKNSTVIKFFISGQSPQIERCCIHFTKQALSSLRMIDDSCFWSGITVKINYMSAPLNVEIHELRHREKFLQVSNFIFRIISKIIYVTVKRPSFFRNKLWIFLSNEYHFWSKMYLLQKHTIRLAFAAVQFLKFFENGCF